MLLTVSRPAIRLPPEMALSRVADGSLRLSRVTNRLIGLGWLRWKTWKSMPAASGLQPCGAAAAPAGANSIKRNRNHATQRCMCPIIYRISPSGEVLRPPGGENIPVFYWRSEKEKQMGSRGRWWGVCWCASINLSRQLFDKSEDGSEGVGLPSLPCARLPTRQLWR